MFTLIPSAYLNYFAPEIVLTIWAMGLLLAEAFVPLTAKRVAQLALVGIVVTAIRPSSSIPHPRSSGIKWRSGTVPRSSSIFSSSPWPRS